MIGSIRKKQKTKTVLSIGLKRQYNRFSPIVIKIKVNKQKGYKLAKNFAYTQLFTLVYR